MGANHSRTISDALFRIYRFTTNYSGRLLLYLGSRAESSLRRL